MSSAQAIGGFFIICGILFFIRPNFDRVGIGLLSAIMQDILTPRQYMIFMRISGIMFVLFGIWMLIAW